jgi:Flp pilus assembly protein TadG
LKDDSVVTKAIPTADLNAKRTQGGSPRRCFVRDRRGVAAIEFAMIALPLFIMIGGIMEMALVLLISISLEDAASAMARQIRIGNYIAPGATSSTSLATFKADLCADIKLVPTATCVQQIQVDVRPLTATFSSTATSPISGGSFNSTGLCFYSGSGGTPVLMRVYYLWPLLTPFLLNGLENVNSYTTSSGATAGRWAAVSATEVFVNEQSGTTNTSGTSC